MRVAIRPILQAISLLPQAGMYIIKGNLREDKKGFCQRTGARKLAGAKGSTALDSAETTVRKQQPDWQADR